MKNNINNGRINCKIIPSKDKKKVIVEASTVYQENTIKRRFTFKRSEDKNNDYYINLAKRKMSRFMKIKKNKVGIIVLSALSVTVLTLSAVLISWAFTKSDPIEPQPVSGLTFEISEDSDCALLGKDGNKITKLENLTTGDVIAGTIVYQGNEHSYHIPHVISGFQGTAALKSNDYTYNPQTGQFLLVVQYDNLKLNIKANNAIVSFNYVYDQPGKGTDSVSFITDSIDYKVDWGDGTTDCNVPTHTFPETSKAGDEYCVNIFNNDLLTTFSFHDENFETETSEYLAYKNVVSLSLYEGITTIKECGFTKSESLRNVYFPKGVTSVGHYAFSDCKSLTKIDIPSDFDLSNWFVFENDINVTELNIAEGIKEIGYYCFSNLKSLKSLHIPASVEYIDNCNSFAGCESLETITVDSMNPVYEARDNAIVTKIETDDYYANTLVVGCKNSVIGNSIKEIGMDAFEGIAQLTSINIPSNVETIWDDAFRDCASLQSVTLSDGLETICSYAFFGCTSLTGINIPETVEDIQYGIFAACDGLQTITVDENNEYFKSIGNAIVTKQETGLFSTNTLIAGCSNTKINENTIESIGESAFSYLKTSFDLVLPNDSMLTIIEDYAFEDSTGIITINIPNSIEYIGGCAFTNWTENQTVNLDFTKTQVDNFVSDGTWDPDWNHNNTEDETMSRANFIFKEEK